MALPSVSDTVKDPVFLGLDPVEQRSVLSQIDPNYASLPATEQNKVVLSLRKQRKETPQTGQLEEARLSPFQQVALFPVNPTAAFAYQLLPKSSQQAVTTPIESASFGGLQAAGEIPGALANLATQLPQTLNPAFNISQKIASALGAPNIGEIARSKVAPVQDLAPKILRALGVETATPEGPQFKAPGFAALGEFGANIGLGAPAAPEEASVAIAKTSDVIGKIPKIPGKLTSGLIEAISPGYKSRNLPATVEESAISVLDLTSKEAKQQVPIINQRIAEANLPTPKTAEDVVSNMQSAAQGIVNKRLDVNKRADELGLGFNGQDAVEAARAELEPLKLITPEEKQAILNDVQSKVGGQQTAQSGHELQTQLNAEIYSTQRLPEFKSNNPQILALKAARDAVANAMDEIGMAVTGNGERFYRDYGVLTENSSNLQRNIDSMEKAVANAKTGITKAPKSPNIPTTKYQAATQIKKGLLSGFQKNQSEKLNEHAVRIVKIGQKRPPVLNLSPEEVSALRQKYTLQSPVEVPSINIPPLSIPIEKTDLGQSIARQLGISLRKPTANQIETIRKIASEGQIIQ